MRWTIALAGVVPLFLSPARAGDHSWLDRFVQRAPLPRQPQEHSAERAGYPLAVRAHAVPSVTQFDAGGYIGGASLRNNCLRAHGPGSATGPLQDGTYGTDYVGCRQHLSRVFLAPSTDPSAARPIYLRYRAEGPRIPDPFALLAFRKAVFAAREEAEGGHGEGGHGEGGHGEGGHGEGGEGGHKAEGGEGKGEK
jgi:hypothetical protein